MHETGQLTLEQFDTDFAYRRISDKDKVHRDIIRRGFHY